MEKTTILLDKKILNLLKQSKDYPRQTYNELLEKMANIFIKLKQRKSSENLFQTH